MDGWEQVTEALHIVLVAQKETNPQQQVEINDCMAFLTANFLYLLFSSDPPKILQSCSWHLCERSDFQWDLPLGPLFWGLNSDSWNCAQMLRCRSEHRQLHFHCIRAGMQVWDCIKKSIWKGRLAFQAWLSAPFVSYSLQLISWEVEKKPISI